MGSCETCPSASLVRSALERNDKEALRDAISDCQALQLADDLLGGDVPGKVEVSRDYRRGKGKNGENFDENPEKS